MIANRDRTERILIRAAKIIDGDGRVADPGAILVAGDLIQAAGTPESVGCPDGVTVIDLPNSIVIPALVNAHAHLDLTHIGPRPSGGSFDAWIEMILAERARDDDGIARSVREGIRLARAGGTAAIGDIAGIGSHVPLQVMRAESMLGTSFVEVFGIGQSESATLAALADASRWSDAEPESATRLGIQPHAPYSCSRPVYDAASRLGLPMATHLAESLEEIEFTQDGTGRFRAMLERIGVWSEDIRISGQHPVDHLRSVLCASPTVAAHLNYVDDGHLDVLAAMETTVAYCPRASHAFGHPADGASPHRYRAMLEAGINVALGTDSIVCLDTSDRISVLDDMRFLYRRDSTDPEQLLAMATTNGARALQFDPDLVSLRPGPTLGLLAIDIEDDVATLENALRVDAPPRWLVGPFASDTSETSDES